MANGMRNARNKLFIGERDSGKTSALYRGIRLARLRNRPVLAVDSATAHEDRSLWHRLARDSLCPIVAIEFPRGDANPRSSLGAVLFREMPERIVAVDVSHFLEMGHLQADRSTAQAVRKRYQDETSVVLQCVADGLEGGRFPRLLVVLDEIEINERICREIRRIERADGEVLAALHPPLVDNKWTGDFEMVRLKPGDAAKGVTGHGFDGAGECGHEKSAPGPHQPERTGFKQGHFIGEKPHDSSGNKGGEGLSGKSRVRA